MAEWPVDTTVAYVLKGFPRLSELFIASEIVRLEQAGVGLRLYVLKPPDEPTRHSIVDSIRARPTYLPATTTVSGTRLLRWLAANLGPFLGPLGRTAARQPVGLARAALAAFGQAVRARPRRWSAPRKVYLKELLQAVALADRVRTARDVRHLHAHFAHGSTTVAWLASRITGLPFSFTGHAKDIYETSLNPAGLLRRKLLAARFVVTCTEANRDHLLRIAPEADVRVVRHGLNAELARLLVRRAPPAPLNGTLHLLAVGRLVEKKGFDVLVDACDGLARAGVAFEATIVGEEGDAGDGLRRRIARYGLERQVSLAGPRSQAELLDLFRRATAFCLPCRVLESGDRDGIPNVLVEAMASGVPVVTTPVSGIPELVEADVNGILVGPEDPDALVRAVLRLHGDGELRGRIALAGRKTVRERFDGDALAGHLAAFFREVVS